MFGLRYAEENRELKDEVRRYKEELSDEKYYRSQDVKKQNRDMHSEVEKRQNLEDKIEVLGNNIQTSKDLQEREVELATKENILNANISQFEDLSTELKKAKEKGEELAEEKYKTGYADGLADGLRKIHEITAEDRKQAMQVAALAASSHTPEAATRVAEGIRQDMMALPAGKKSGNK